MIKALLGITLLLSVISCNLINCEYQPNQGGGYTQSNSRRPDFSTFQP